MGNITGIILALTMYYIVFYPYTHDEKKANICCFRHILLWEMQKPNVIYSLNISKMINEVVYIAFYCIIIQDLCAKSFILNASNSNYSHVKCWKYTKYLLISDIKQKNWHKITRKAVNLRGADNNKNSNLEQIDKWMKSSKFNCFDDSIVCIAVCKHILYYFYTILFHLEKKK
eukprot:162469_1